MPIFTFLADDLFRFSFKKIKKASCLNCTTISNIINILYDGKDFIVFSGSFLLKTHTFEETWLWQTSFEKY